MAGSRRYALVKKGARTKAGVKQNFPATRAVVEVDAAAYGIARQISGGTRASGRADAVIEAGYPGLDPSVLRRVLSEVTSIKVLGAAIAANPEPVSPELARSLQAEENWWRKIETDLPSLSSTEAAAKMGAKPTNRNFASAQRASGKLLGYTRRNAVRYPKFQFDARGAVLPVIPKLIAAARAMGVSDEDLILWLASPSTLFAAQDRPVDHLDDPERLLAAARDEFGAEW